MISISAAWFFPQYVASHFVMCVLLENCWPSDNDITVSSTLHQSTITDPTPHLLPGWHAQGPEGAHQPTQQQFSSDPMVCTHCRRKLLAWKHLGILNVAVTVRHAKRWKCKGLKIPKMWTQNPKLVKTEHLLEKKWKNVGPLWIQQPSLWRSTRKWATSGPMHM